MRVLQLKICYTNLELADSIEILLRGLIKDLMDSSYVDLQITGIHVIKQSAATMNTIGGSGLDIADSSDILITDLTRAFTPTFTLARIFVPCRN